MGAGSDAAATEAFQCPTAAPASTTCSESRTFEGQICAKQCDNGIDGKMNKLTLWKGGVERRVNVRT